MAETEPVSKQIAVRLPIELHERLARAVRPGGALHTQGIEGKAQAMKYGLRMALDQAEANAA